MSRSRSSRTPQVSLPGRQLQLCTESDIAGHRRTARWSSPTTGSTRSAWRTWSPSPTPIRDDRTRELLHALRHDALECRAFGRADRFSPAERSPRAHLVDGTFLFGNHSTVMYRSDIVRATERLLHRRPSVFFDTDAALRILADHDFAFIHQVLSYLRVHPGSDHRTAPVGYSPDRRPTT